MGNSSEEYYHNKGQEDFAKGVYERPDSPIDLLHESSDEFVSNCEAYDKGYENAKEQSGE